MLRHEYLIILAEGVLLPEEILVELHSTLSDIEHFLVVHVGHKRLSGIDSHQRQALSLALMVAEGSSHDSIQVSRDAERFVEPNCFLIARFSIRCVDKKLRCMCGLFFQCLCRLGSRLNLTFVRNDGPIRLCLAGQTPGCL